MTGPVENENMEVDIGHMPQMELTVPSPSSHIAMYGENGEVLQEAKPPVRDLENNKITWNSQISMEEAVRILELHFYPFKSVSWELVDTVDQIYSLGCMEFRFYMHKLVIIFNIFQFCVCRISSMTD